MLLLLIQVCSAVALAETIPLSRGPHLGWKDHNIRVGTGAGKSGFIKSQLQFLHAAQGNYLMPFGLAKMDNGEIVLLASWERGNGSGEIPLVSISKDNGDTWSDWETIPGAAGRPMMLAYLGKGNLTFYTGERYYSSDYGRTWPDRVPVQPASNGRPWWPEGNTLVDYDADGNAIAMAETTGNYPDSQWPNVPSDAFFRWSYDWGRTWVNEVKPETWRWVDKWEGKDYVRSVCEGALVRAGNGWIVAVMRTDLPARYLNVPNDDNFCGTAVSISKDDGKTWSQMKMLYEAGRHHGNLIRLPNGNIVLTLICRTDIRDQHLASYRRGCDALISKDNGQTWDLSRKYTLDEYEYFDGKTWQNGECGHLYSISLGDGRILTVFGNYLSKGACLVRWKP